MANKLSGWLNIFSWRIVILTVVLVFAAASYLVGRNIAQSVEEREWLKSQHLDRVAEREALTHASAKGLAARIRVAKSGEDWRRLLENDLPRSSREEQTVFGPRIRLKVFETDFWKSEQLMARARSLLDSDKNHPVGKKYLEEADRLYIRNQDLVENLADGVDSALMKARVHYLLGVFYYRSLGLASLLEKVDGGKGINLVKLAIGEFDKALSLKTLDRDTQVAIEVLQKNTKEFLAAGGSTGQGATEMRLRLLPQGDKEGPNGGPLGRQGGRT